MNALVKNDSYDWTVPEKRTYEKEFRLQIAGRLETMFAYSGKSNPSNYGSINGKAELKITAPIVK
ncbi:MAG: hypothetical protein A2Z18_02680 [Armatimonadetes bacterium RBG_16_58_9]|nr:MAG: hypothetical protein A2Z18_02680 [Armatimonadetes bacterium RBG_16_58_9]